MPSRVWSHICDYAAIDANGKAMIVGEFDHIFTQSVPLKYPILYVSTKWNGNDKETFTHAVRITSPSSLSESIALLQPETKSKSPMQPIVAKSSAKRRISG